MKFPGIFLKQGKEQSVLRFHPWVFSGAILRTEGEVHDGDVVDVFDHKGKYLATGHAADGSIAVRIFSFTGYDGLNTFWEKKIENAWQLRQRIGLADSSETTIWRLIHGEGDGLPGLIVDVYGKTAVIQSHSSGMYLQRRHIAEAIVKVMGQKIAAVYDRGDGKTGSENPQGGEYLFGKKEDDVCLEYGAKFHVDWEQGQKTGFFIDQRDNRKLLGQYSQGKKVLNTFCYTGGFSVHALHDGAALVHSLDSSQRALDLAVKNVSLNGFEADRHDIIRADAVEYLRQKREDYDVIVLDPPAFAKHLSARHKAVQGYIRINEAALKQIKKGGILFTFSCSQVVDKKLFRDSVMAAAIQAGRDVRILHQLQQPPDHPVSIFHPEGEYLKGLVLEVE
ncbi:MAG: class I SAM-dependent rRNA methyltransferase [Flavobacteriales bacterium]|nr:class I SAM-dependent rRNA methyltransferase [Flavobacteriales bacterium]